MILSCSRIDTIVILSMQGNFTFSDSKAFKPSLEIADYTGVSKCVLDMRECHLIDSIGLGLIMDAQAFLEKRGVALELAHTQGQVLRMLQVANFQSFVKIVPLAA